MRRDWGHLEKWRLLDLPKGSDPWVSLPGEHFGCFLVRRAPAKADLLIVATCGDETMPWEHVSVSCKGRCPTWDEMAYVKSLFWGTDETVMQLHVPDAEHKNFHPYCLHLWRPLQAEIPRPPSIAVAA